MSSYLKSKWEERSLGVAGPRALLLQLPPGKADGSPPLQRGQRDAVRGLLLGSHAGGRGEKEENRQPQQYKRKGREEEERQREGRRGKEERRVRLGEIGRGGERV